MCNSSSQTNAQPIVTSIDTMREAAQDVLVKRGWKPGSTLGFQNITGLMAEFGMQVYRGEIGCDYPNCGCCADAACEDAINQHPDLGGTPPQTNMDAYETDRMTPIDDLISELQGIRAKFGNTCVYLRRGGMSWGAVALNRRSDDEKNGVFDMQAQHDKDMLALIDRIERLKAERTELRAGIKRLSDEEELCAETTGDDPFSMVYLAAKLATAESRIADLITERDNLATIVASGLDEIAGAALDDAEETIQRLTKTSPPQPSVEALLETKIEPDNGYSAVYIKAENGSVAIFEDSFGSADPYKSVWMSPAQFVKIMDAYDACHRPSPSPNLQAIARAAQVYIESVDGVPENDCWDTEDGKEAPGALRFASDWAWQEYDAKKQKAFDDLRAALTTTEGQP